MCKQIQYFKKSFAEGTKIFFFRKSTLKVIWNEFFNYSEYRISIKLYSKPSHLKWPRKVDLINLFMISCKQILHLRFHFSLADLVIGFKNNFQIKYSWRRFTYSCSPLRLFFGYIFCTQYTLLHYIEIEH